MSQSLKSWLFASMADQAQQAHEGGLTLQDLPFVTGNRVQVVSFLTFRPAEDPLADQDVWAIVSERTHLMAAKFVRGQVTRFQRNHPSNPFTTLRGSLLMLRTVRAIITKIPSTSKATLWHRDEFNLAVEVRSFDLLGSIGEPTFWPDAKLVLHQRGVLPGDQERWKVLMAWVDKWTRYRAKREAGRRASATLKAIHEGESKSDASFDPVSGQILPTPAQRLRSDPAIFLTRSAERIARCRSDSHLVFARQRPYDKGHIDFAVIGRTQHAAVGRCKPLATHDAESGWADFDLDANEVPPPEPVLEVDLEGGPQSSLEGGSNSLLRHLEAETHRQKQGKETLPSCTLGADWGDQVVPDPAELGLLALQFLSPDGLAGAPIEPPPSSSSASTISMLPSSPLTAARSIIANRTKARLTSTPAKPISFAARALSSDAAAASFPASSRPDSLPSSLHPIEADSTKQATVRFEGISSDAASSPPAPVSSPTADGLKRKRSAGQPGASVANTTATSRSSTKVDRAKKRKSDAKDKLRLLMASIVD